MATSSELSFKAVVEKSLETHCEVDKGDIPHTYEEFIAAYNEYIKTPMNTSNDTKQLQLVNDYMDDVLSYLGDRFHMLKEKYTDHGFLNEFTFGDFLRLLKNNIYIEESMRETEDDIADVAEDDIII